MQVEEAYTPEMQATKEQAIADGTFMLSGFLDIPGFLDILGLRLTEDQQTSMRGSGYKQEPRISWTGSVIG